VDDLAFRRSLDAYLTRSPGESDALCALCGQYSAQVDDEDTCAECRAQLRAIEEGDADAAAANAEEGAAFADLDPLIADRAEVDVYERLAADQLEASRDIVRLKVAAFLAAWPMVDGLGVRVPNAETGRVVLTFTANGARWDHEAEGLYVDGAEVEAPGTADLATAALDLAHVIAPDAWWTGSEGVTYARATSEAA